MRLLNRIAAVCLSLSIGVAAQAQDKPKPAPDKVKPTEGAGAYGKVKSISDKSITLEGKKKEGGEAAPDVTYAISADVKVMAGKEAKTIKDIKAGDMVKVMLSEDKKTVTMIGVAGGGDKPVKPGDKPGVKPEGDKPGVKKPEGDKPAVKKPEGDGVKKPVENK